MLSLSKVIQKEFKVESLNFEVSKKLQSLINWNKIQQIRIKWDNILKQWYLIIIYNKKEMEKLKGIEVRLREESYTSGCSAFDLEPINKKYYDKTRRVVRGLFNSSFGLVNSDVNGSLNILRKEEKCIPKLVETMRDKGKCFRPLRIRVAC